MHPARGSLYIVSTGPAGLEHLTPAAGAAISDSALVLGYRIYLQYLEPILEGKEVVAFEMGQEQTRAKAAIDLAWAGRRVALVSGDNAGVYSMAGLAFRFLEDRNWTPICFR